MVVQMVVVAVELTAGAVDVEATRKDGKPQLRPGLSIPRGEG